MVADEVDGRDGSVDVELSSQILLRYVVGEAGEEECFVGVGSGGGIGGGVVRLETALFGFELGFAPVFEFDLLQSGSRKSEV